MTKRKRLSSALLLASLVLGCSACGQKQTLLFLNWGEYIDEDILSAFEKKYNCNVYMDLGESNEIFYSKVRGGTTVYDVVCPSDYMVEKMYMNDMIQKIDWSRLEMSKFNPRDNNVRPGVQSIFNDMDSNLKRSLGDSYESGTIQDYALPYLWGTWGIMYTTTKDGVKNYYDGLAEDAKNPSGPTKNQWAGLFDRSVLPSGTRVAMYDSHQHAYYAASRYMEKTSEPLAVDYGVELSAFDLNRMRTLVETMNYDAWGTDNIKKDIVAGNIDVGFMWTGDFLYYYAENAASQVIEAYSNGDVDILEVGNMMNALCDSGVREYTGSKGNTYDIGFDCFIPEDTVAFADNLVITKDSANVDLAYKFLDFMASYQTSAYLKDGKEVDPSTLDDEDILTPHYSNTYYVDYDATTCDIYDDLVGLKDYEFTKSEKTLSDADVRAISEDDIYDMDDETIYRWEVLNGYSPEDTTLYGIFYDYVIGIAFNKYYPRETKKGSILATFSRTYINTINATFNNARA